MNLYTACRLSYVIYTSSLSQVLTWKFVFSLNTIHPPDHSHPCSLNATSFSFLTGQVSLPCNMLLRTQLLYNLPLIINDTSLFVSSGTNCLYLFQFEFWPPQLHEHLNPHSAFHLGSKTYPLTPNFALAPISTLLRPALVTGFKQLLQMNEFATFDMLPFIPLHFLCTHF